MAERMSPRVIGDVVTRQFRTSARHGGSYDMDAVSEFLDRVAAALQQHEQRVP